MAEQTLGLQLAQPRIDGAGRGPVGAAEPLAQHGEQPVTVAWLPIEQGQQMEPHLAVGEAEVVAHLPFNSWMTDAKDSLARMR